MSMADIISPGLSLLQAPGQFSFVAPRYLIRCVATIEEIRHANLLLILKDMAASHGERGAIQRLAVDAGKSHSQISQLKTRQKHSKTGKARNIGSKMARAIEAAAGKSVGWLDVAHDAADGINEKIEAAVARQLDERFAAGGRSISANRTASKK